MTLLASRRPSDAVLLGISLILASSVAHALEAPDSGRLLETIRPIPAQPLSRPSPLPPGTPERSPQASSSQVPIAVSEFRITGASAIPVATLQSLLADARHKSHTLAQLQELAGRVTDHYRAAGYILARAYLPPQDIKNGIVEIAVLEGKLGNVSTDNQSFLPSRLVQGPLSKLRSGEAVSGASLERSVLLLNDLPGIQTTSTLKPGASVGTTDLDIRVTGDKRYSADLGLDNYGNRYTGAYRLNGGITLNSPLGQGETLSFRGSTAGSDFNYGRLAAQAPVGNDGLKLGVAWSDMSYRLGKDFSSLDAHGTAKIGSLYALYPLVRSSAFNLHGQALYDHKNLKDQVDATATTTDKQVDVLTLGLSGDRNDQDGAGNLRWNLSWTTGQLHLDPTNKALDQAGHATAGHYDKLSLQVSRLRALNNDMQLFAQITGQQAAKNLDSSEKLSLGGANAIRAYPQGEAPADDAWFVNLELRKVLAPQWQILGFFDAGVGQLNHKPIAADAHNQRHLSGAGLGLNWIGQGGLMVQSTLAWRTDGHPTADKDKTPRLWFQLIQYF